ncbi:ABC transporter ATP-binding protein [Streptosporangium sp. NPDC002544]|uniref:ABC transporter ATP-binding protein n=1 Tax=Streptosporangium sp. NPDC002544 TaxID=3154538 RepID=UPI00331E9CF9
MSENILELHELRKAYPIRKGMLGRTVNHVRAVDGVDLRLKPSRTLGLVGESGSGKSTLGRLALRLIDPTAGRVLFDGADITTLSRARIRRLRREMQMVFQDPYSSLDPMATVGSSIAEPLRTHGYAGDRQDRVVELLEMVGLQPSHRLRYPQEMSGGQLQRVAIARALAFNPKLLVLDEPVSALDVSTQADVINLLTDLQGDQQVAYLFIAHDLAVVRHVSHDIAVMYLGRVVEYGPAEEVYTRPKHPYTQGLLSAIPVPDPVAQRARKRISLQGEIPSPARPPAGCRFHTRCPYVMDICRSVEPDPHVGDDGTTVYCHLHTSGPALAGRSVVDLPLPRRREPVTAGEPA